MLKPLDDNYVKKSTRSLKPTKAIDYYRRFLQQKPDEFETVSEEALRTFLIIDVLMRRLLSSLLVTVLLDLLVRSLDLT
ncbi:unnamed protein product [Arabidopsis halleri]